jgi:hypothetical protein
MLEDVALFFADFAVTAVHGGDTAKVHHDIDTRTVLDGMGLGDVETITFPADKLPGLANGSSLTVDGVAYTVREVNFIDDGKLKTATLRRAA